MAVTNYYTINGQIIAEETGGTRIDYLTDALGNVTATVDQSANIINTYRYKPFGGLLAKTGVGADPAFQWVGSQGYRQTGKSYSDVYIRARHYSSEMGRWITEDPSRLVSEELNRAIYSENSPTTNYDPSGLIFIRGTATCDKGGPKVFCNCGHEGCPSFATGYTGAWADVCYSCGATPGTHEPWEYRQYEGTGMPPVGCGQIITVRALPRANQPSLCAVKIKVIDQGPGRQTGNLVDLHEKAAEDLWNCVQKAKPEGARLPFHCGVEWDKKLKRYIGFELSVSVEVVPNKKCQSMTPHLRRRKK